MASPVNRSCQQSCHAILPGRPLCSSTDSTAKGAINRPKAKPCTLNTHLVGREGVPVGLQRDQDLRANRQRGEQLRVQHLQLQRARVAALLHSHANLVNTLGSLESTDQTLLQPVFLARGSTLDRPLEP